MKTRKSYSKEFKLDAITLVREQYSNYGWHGFVGYSFSKQC
ncbi:hypothetical protein [Shewanella frigidimarina]|nr:hypothetical protein [Shewanella frigidimarina]